MSPSPSNRSHTRTSFLHVESRTYTAKAKHNKKKIKHKKIMKRKYSVEANKKKIQKISVEVNVVCDDE